MENQKKKREAVPENLQHFFRKNTKLALAFSGGTDSAYVLYAAGLCDAEVHAYFVKAQFQPDFELADAKRFAAQYGAKLTVIAADVLENEVVAKNPPDRCYHCKQVILSAIAKQAKADGFDRFMDGGNASDDAGDRPGMRAVAEWQVLSPLEICGITKTQVRALSKAAGLFTWDKPSYACLATRFPTNMPITAPLLQVVEKAEATLFAMGFSDFRVRILSASAAKLQFPADQMETVLARRSEILAVLTEDFTDVLLDLKARPAAM